MFVCIVSVDRGNVVVLISVSINDKINVNVNVHQELSTANRPPSTYTVTFNRQPSTTPY